MNYFFYNADVDADEFKGKSRTDFDRRINFLIEQGLAVTGGAIQFGEQLGKLSPDDRILMYENKVGIVAAGKVREKWDGRACPDTDPKYYDKQVDEYHIKVDWVKIDSPINPQELRMRLFLPRGAVKPIVKKRPEAEKMFFEILGHHLNHPFLIPEEVCYGTERILEGAKTRITGNAYERDPRARERCIEHWGTRCQVCGVDLQDVYGTPATGYTHVHHLIPLSEIQEQYAVDPLNDLRPVCPNCHAVLHRKNPPYTIDDVKGMIQRADNKQYNVTP
ncbi:MAG TPA: HNH endonuclease [Candidatus Brocadiia bacterium]|nr:HNH endonuclease [Candidatus Brocadiia bacterium]